MMKNICNMCNNIYSQTKFNLNDQLPLNKTIETPTMLQLKEPFIMKITNIIHTLCYSYTRYIIL